MNYCIPDFNSGQSCHQRCCRDFLLLRSTSKSICLRPFKFGIGVYLGDVSSELEFRLDLQQIGQCRPLESQNLDILDIFWPTSFVQPDLSITHYQRVLLLMGLKKAVTSPTSLHTRLVNQTNLELS